RIAPSEHHRGGCAPAISGTAVRLQAGRSRCRALERRSARVLSFPSRSSSPALAVRPGSCVAVLLVRDCLYSTGRAGQDDRVAAGRRSLAVSRSTTLWLTKF